MPRIQFGVSRDSGGRISALECVGSGSKSGIASTFFSRADRVPPARMTPFDAGRLTGVPSICNAKSPCRSRTHRPTSTRPARLLGCSIIAISSFAVLKSRYLCNNRHNLLVFSDKSERVYEADNERLRPWIREAVPAHGRARMLESARMREELPAQGCARMLESARMREELPAQGRARIRESAWMREAVEDLGPRVGRHKKSRAFARPS